MDILKGGGGNSGSNYNNNSNNNNSKSQGGWASFEMEPTDHFARMTKKLENEIHSINVNVSSLRPMINTLGSNKDTHEFRIILSAKVEDTRRIANSVGQELKQLSLNRASEELTEVKLNKLSKLKNDYEIAIQHIGELSKQHSRLITSLPATQEMSKPRNHYQQDIETGQMDSEYNNEEENRQVDLRKQKLKLVQLDGEVDVQDAIYRRTRTRYSSN